ncbi:MAG TPA: sugar transferase [Myxococcota bacterium]|jgi:exopolysaccharide biosynthesis polyprenyl glycosylphosphotransferase|nr:sugar transferase [Myxococcota bacterium]
MRYYLLNLYIRRVAFAAALDLAALLVAATLTWFLASPPFSAAGYWLAIGGAAVANFVLLYYANAYGLTVLGSGRRTLSTVTASLGVAVVAVLGLHFVFRFQQYTVETMANVAGVYIPLLLGGRMAFRVLSSHPRFTRRVLVIGTSDLARAIARAVRERRNLGTEIAGFLSDDLDDQGAWIEGYPVLAQVHHIDKILAQDRISRIVVASKRRSEYFPAEELMATKLTGVKVESGVAFYERVTGRIYLRELRASYLIFSAGFAGGPWLEVPKRMLDVVVSSLGLLVGAPLIGLAALAIRLDSPGPIFFGQPRVGKGGRVFQCWKLRSMKHGAERETGPVFAGQEDDRKTRVGKILRMSRIDELPQLWNVLIGDMSMVGPRPERPEFVETLSERYPYFRMRSALKPGITGWAQIRYGYVNDVVGYEDKLALDLYYLKYRSLFMDVLILWKTLKTVLLMSGI